MKTVESLARDCLELPVRERMSLVRRVLEVSEAERGGDCEVASVWEEEIQARMRAVRRGEVRAFSAEEVFADLDRRFPG